MTKLFVQILQMSISASYVIIAILLARLILKKAPKKYSYALWSVAAFRLLCPYSFESIFSLFNLHLGGKEKPAIDLTGVTAAPGTETIVVDTGIPVVSQTIQQVTNTAPAAPVSETIGETIVSAAQEIAPVQQVISSVDIIAWIWVTGVIALFAYGLISYVKLQRKMRMSMPLRDNIRQAYIRTPFILGFIKPTIYIPFDLEPMVENISISHERCHIHRGDHIVKLLSYLILIIHWLNPLCWLAYFEMGEDMEMSVDEYVLSHYRDISRSYSTVLLSFSTGKKFSLASPLAFGETSIKARIVNVITNRKKSRWISVFACVLCIAVFVACGTNSIPSVRPSGGPTDSGDALINSTDNNSFVFLSFPTSIPGGGITRGYDAVIHKGYDIWGELGKDILAVADGVVLEAGYQADTWGYYVVIDHENGYITLYAHCEDLLVRQGDLVQAGERIATMGCSGACTGVLLHFELQNDAGESLDPTPYLDTVYPGLALEMNSNYKKNPLTGLVKEDISIPVAITINNFRVGRTVEGGAVARVSAYGISKADILIEYEHGMGNTRYIGLFSDYNDLTKVGGVVECTLTEPSLFESLDILSIHTAYALQMRDMIQTSYHNNNVKEFDLSQYKELIIEDQTMQQVDSHYSKMINGESINKCILNSNISEQDAIIPPFLLFAPPSKNITSRQSASRVNFILSSFEYVSFEYDVNTQMYYKKELDYSGSELVDTIDLETGERLGFDNIILLNIDGMMQEDGWRIYDFTHGGTGYFFTRGTWEEITWKREKGMLFAFYDQNGERAYLNCGKSYIALIAKEDPNTAESNTNKPINDRTTNIYKPLEIIA